MTDDTLRARLAREIALTGPMTVADYVTRCLHDPAGGYYAAHPALGAGGDFITAPLVSQMFGELIGLWAVLQLAFTFVGPSFGAVAWWAHLAGFIVGLGYALALKPMLARRSRGR